MSTTFYPTDGKIVIIKNDLTCVKCKESVLGDPKYHQVYDTKGLLIGYRHRKCIL